MQHSVQDAEKQLNNKAKQLYKNIVVFSCELESIIDIIILIVFSIVVWIMAWTKTKLNKGEGLIMLALYIAYAVYICVR